MLESEKPQHPEPGLFWGPPCLVREARRWKACQVQTISRTGKRTVALFLQCDVAVVQPRPRLGSDGQRLKPWAAGSDPPARGEPFRAVRVQHVREPTRKRPGGRSHHHWSVSASEDAREDYWQMRQFVHPGRGMAVLTKTPRKLGRVTAPAFCVLGRAERSDPRHPRQTSSCQCPPEASPLSCWR
jgi:hypothetical protein